MVAILPKPKYIYLRLSLGQGDGHLQQINPSALCEWQHVDINKNVVDAMSRDFICDTS